MMECPHCGSNTLFKPVLGGFRCLKCDSFCTLDEIKSESVEKPEDINMGWSIRRLIHH
ncbi:MAG: hypothetical protein ACLPWD_06385 [Methanobacterium sp.]